MEVAAAARVEDSAAAVFVHGFEIDEARRRVRKEGRDVELTDHSPGDDIIVSGGRFDQIEEPQSLLGERGGERGAVGPRQSSNGFEFFRGGEPL